MRLGCLSQSNGTAMAFSTSFVSISPQAFARAPLPFTLSASVIALFSSGSFATLQFTFPVGTINLPLNVMLRTVCGSAKSAIHPTFGQIEIFSFGTLQNFAYIVEVSTSVNFVLKPRLFSVELTISASCSAGGPLAPTTVTVSLPVYLPDG